MGIAEISSKSNEDLDSDRECSVPPLPGDIAEISSKSDGDTRVFKRIIGPRFKLRVLGCPPAGLI